MYYWANTEVTSPPSRASHVLRRKVHKDPLDQAFVPRERRQQELGPTTQATATDHPSPPSSTLTLLLGTPTQIIGVPPALPIQCGAPVPFTHFPVCRSLLLLALRVLAHFVHPSFLVNVRLFASLPTLFHVVQGCALDSKMESPAVFST